MLIRRGECGAAVFKRRCLSPEQASVTALPASATAFVLLSARKGAPYRSAFHTVKGNARLPGVCRYTVELKKKNHLMSKPIGLVRELLEITPEGQF